MKLPKIYEHFGYGRLFTIDEAREKLETTGNTLRKRLSELSGRNYIHPIRQGLYRVAQPGEAPDQRRSHPFHVASKLTPAGYLAFQSALELHAGECPEAGANVYVVSATKFNSFPFEGRLFFWCQNPDAEGVERLAVNDAGEDFEVRVTTFEKSIVDCLKRTAHSPTLARLRALCLASGRRPDFATLSRLSAECHVAALFNRLGFFLEMMANEWEVPRTLLEDCERRMSRKVTEWPIESGFRAPSDEESPGNPASLTARDPAVRARWKVVFPQETLQAVRGAAAPGIEQAGASANTLPRGVQGATGAPRGAPATNDTTPVESPEEKRWFHA